MRSNLSRFQSVAAAGALLAAASLFASSVPANTVATDLDERVAPVVKSEIVAQGVPGVSVAVMRDGKMLLERAFGVADVEKNVAASKSTTYPIGSLTKQFTAALLLKQVERGRLALADPIGKHFPGLDAGVGAVTVEQLLNHTSGMKRPIVEPETRFEQMSVESLLAKAVKDKLEAKPGTTFSYSNAGYTILGVLVEKLYGKSYAAALHDEIAVPLRLTTLTRCAEPKPGEASGYGREQGGGKPGRPPGLHHSQYLGAGGVCASAADLVRWTHALHTGRVLSPASYQAMTTPRGAAVASHYGFGLSVERTSWGDAVIAHGGQSLTGHVAELHWYPQHSLAAALLYNAYPRVPGVADLVPRIVLGVPLPEKKAASREAPPARPATPAERATLAGVYGTAQRSFEVTLENGALHVTPPAGENQPLVFRSGNTYAIGAADSTTTATFIVENGAVTGFEADANGNKRMLKKIR